MLFNPVFLLKGEVFTVGNIFKKFFSGKKSFAFATITALTVSIAISIIYLTHGIFTTFQNIFFIPIIMLSTHYLKKGFIYSVILAVTSFIMLTLFTSDTVIITEGLIRVGAFIVISGVLTYMSGRQHKIISDLKRSEALNIDNIKELASASEEIKLNNMRLESIVQILQYDSRSLHDFLDYALDAAIQITSSRIGYIFYYDEDKRQFTLNSWSKEAMKECSIQDKPTIYDLDKTGIWGEAVRQSKYIIDNDFTAPGPMKKGYPEGHVKISKFLSVPIFNSGKIVAVIGVANKEADYGQTDVVQLSLLMSSVWEVVARKIAEDATQYLSYHDKLTGLFNRSFFEEEIKRIDTSRQLPLSIIIGDANGLKLTNDAFGHQTGDRLLCTIAGILKRTCRAEDIISRWGGDEFSILLPKTDYIMADEICGRIKSECDKTEVGSVRLSISFGYATKNDPSESFEQIFKKAEEWMYKHKLLEGRSFRNHLITTLQKTLYEKNRLPHECGDKIVSMSQKTGSGLGLEGKDLDDLKLLAMLYDIGYISIKDSILTKDSEYTSEELGEIMKHPEIGYRIAVSIPEISHLAQPILSHHERWDGKGYPQMLKGTEIPLISRIIFVIDSFCSMVNGKAEGRTLTMEDAENKLLEGAGSLYDPEVVCVFLKELKTTNDNNGENHE
jgi:diguanylate cyclase (GGDEF)-like protein